MNFSKSGLFSLNFSQKVFSGSIGMYGFGAVFGSSNFGVGTVSIGRMLFSVFSKMVSFSIGAGTTGFSISTATGGFIASGVTIGFSESFPDVFNKSIFRLSSLNSSSIPSNLESIFVLM